MDAGPTDPPDRRLVDFVAAYSEDLAADPPADLTPEQSARFARLRSLLHILADCRGTHLAGLSSVRLAGGVRLGAGGRVGRYVLVRELGRGGSGLVYLADDPTLARRVAIKVLHPTLAHGTKLARFRTEGQALAKQRHPNVLQVYEAGEDGGLHFIAMEYVPGSDLHTRLGNTPMPGREAAGLVETVARAVAHAHASGVLHRDLKPQNVLLCPDGTPKVADFGLAATLADGGSGVTATGDVVGSPNYLAPEVVDGRPAGPAVDVYGLGVILYECLTGRPPFAGHGLAFTLLQVRMTDPPPPRSLNDAVPRDLDIICRMCLRKEPERRYPTAAAVADDLRAFLDGKPIRARPVSWVETAGRWCRRHWLLSGLAAGLALAVIGGGSTALYLTAQHRQRDVRDAERADEMRQFEERAALLAARGRYEAAVRQAEAGRVGDGLRGMAEALRLAPPGPAADPFRRAVGLSFAGWTRQQPVLRYAVPLWEPSADLKWYPWVQPLGPDEREFAAWAVGQPVRLYNTAGGRPTGDQWELPAGERPWAVDPAGNLLLTHATADDGPVRLRLRRVRTGEPVGVGADVPRGGDGVPHFIVHSATAVLANGPPTPLAPGPRRAWNLLTGEAFRLSVDGGGGLPARLVQAADGRLLCAIAHPDPQSGAEPYLELWAVETGERVAPGTPLARQPDPYVSADGGALLSLSGDRSVGRGDGTVRWWQAATGRLLDHWQPRRQAVQSVLAADARTLTGCGIDGRLRVFDLDTGWQRGGDLPAGPAPNLGEAGGVFPGGLVPHTDSGGHLLSWETRHLEWQATAASSDRVPARKRYQKSGLSPAGRFAVLARFGPADYNRLADVATGRPVGPPLLQAWLQHVAFSADERLVAVAPHNYHVGGEPLVQVLDTTTGRPVLPAWPAPTFVHALAVSPDGRTLAVARIGGVTLIDLATGDRRELPQKSCAAGLAFHPNGGLLAVGYRSGWDGDGPGIRVWDTASGRPVGNFQPLPEVGTPLAVSFVGEGRRVLAYDRSTGAARLADAATGAVEPHPPLPAGVCALAARPANTVVALALADGTVQQWDVAAGTPVGSPISGLAGVSALEYSPDGGLMAAVAERAVRVWDAATGLPVGPPRLHAGLVLAARFTPGGRLVTATAAGELRHWPLDEPAPADPDLFELWVKAAGDTVPFDPAVWAVCRNELARRWPAGAARLGRWRVASSTDEESDWHHVRAREADATGNLAARLWHLERLARLRPADWAAAAERADALRAAGDGAAATAADANVRSLAPAVGLAEWQKHATHP